MTELVTNKLSLIILWCHLDNLYGQTSKKETELRKKFDFIRTTVQNMVEPFMEYDEFVSKWVQNCSFVYWKEGNWYFTCRDKRKGLV